VVTVVTGRCTGRGRSLTGRVWSVQHGAGARVSDRTLVWPDQRVRSVHLCAEEKRATGASGPSWNRSIRSGVQRGSEQRSGDRTCPVSTGAYWTTTGRWHCRVRSFAGARPVTATVTSDAHCSRLSCSDQRRPVTLTRASGQRDLNCVVR
jgi:hypothetical protein